MAQKNGNNLVKAIAAVAILGILVAIAIPQCTNMKNRSRVKADGAIAKEIIRLARLGEKDTKSSAQVIVENYVKRSFTHNTYPKPQSGGIFELKKDGNDWGVSWTPTNCPGYNTIQKVTESTEENWVPSKE